MHRTGTTTQTAFYTADVISYGDYYPFGALMPNRHGNSSEMRYTFQNQEADNEIKGEGNSINYKYRMHDPRIGRFFAIDPLSSQYAYNSPYAFSENVVIDHVELEGLEKLKYSDGKVTDFFAWFPLGNDEFINQVGVIVVTYKTAEAGVVEALLTYHQYPAYDPETGATIIYTEKNIKWPGTERMRSLMMGEIDNEPSTGLMLINRFKGIDRGTVNIMNWEVGYDALCDGYTNCHGTSLGIQGYVDAVDFMEVIQDNYTPASGPQENAVGVFGNGDHSIIVTGKNNKEEWLYSSNWLNGPRLDDITFDEVLEQMNSMAGDNYGELEGSDFDWYVPKSE